jgi:tRNA A-37 threonylcarbamoyl transferase component Bud32
MTAARLCPQCEKPLAGDAPQGLCPECLLKAAFPRESAYESAATGVFDPSPATTVPSDARARVKYFGDYELLEEIARGGMGVVWKARQSTLNRDVALKLIRAGALASRDEVARFLREAEAAANLQHPNIVAIHEVGEHDGQHYFSMDLVNGRDLAALLADGPLAPQRAARYVKIIAEAIHFAHQRGTLHRDLKPQNVLIDAADQPRITDFGLAKIMKDDSQLTQSGVVMGSPSYMPPEQAAGRTGDIGPASDVYSLGAILYELLTGRPPFRGATAMATLRDVMESEPASPRRLKADIPPDLETICLKCLEKSPAARYSTARALAEELDRFLKGEPIQARPASVVRKAVTWARRHPRALATLATYAIVALLFGVFYLLEENAFLRAQQADPTLARIPGWRSESLENWACVCFFVLIAGSLTSLFLEDRARGFSFVHALTYALTYTCNLGWGRPTRPISQPFDERTRTIVIGAGLIMIGCGVTSLAMVIQAHVWEGEANLGFLFPFYYIVYYGSIIFGVRLLQAVIQDYRLAHYGMPSRQLTAGQIEPIRRALERGFDLRAAVASYRKAVPEADEFEARENVLRLLNSLPAIDPEKFAPPPLSLATLNWMGMAGWAMIEAVILLVFSCLMPPSHRAVSQFAYSVLFGMGGGFPISRVKVPPLWGAALGFAWSAAWWAAWYGTWGAMSFSPACLLGLFFGFTLMTTGTMDFGDAPPDVIRRYRKSVKAIDPEKFAPPPLSLATLNWKFMGMGAVTEAGILGMFWYAMPPSDPTWAVWQFAYCFLFGVGLIAGYRVKGFWNRMLLLAPAAVAMILSHAIVPSAAEAWSYSLSLWRRGVINTGPYGGPGAAEAWSYRISLWLFAYTILLGVFLIASLRVTRFWKKTLLLVPAVVFMFLIFITLIVVGDSDVKHSLCSPGAYLGGLSGGMILMLSGFIPLRSLRKKN